MVLFEYNPNIPNKLKYQEPRTQQTTNKGKSRKIISGIIPFASGLAGALGGAYLASKQLKQGEQPIQKVSYTGPKQLSKAFGVAEKAESMPLSQALIKQRIAEKEENEKKRAKFAAGTLATLGAAIGIGGLAAANKKTSNKK